MNKFIYIFVFFYTISFYVFSSNDDTMNNKYIYNENGRIIIPDNEIISKLPGNGGDLWNRLIFESSPYLLQHAANPVDWYPWCEEAFKLAKKLNKPIFLSIGYTTCHWCHVMEHESFEDLGVSQLMNDTFINIKVDREERPDIDNVYMEVTQELTGRGGWPMTVIMTPDKKPFFAGTYFPKKSRPRYNRIGMLELIPEINHLWNKKNDSLIISANNIVSKIQKKHLSNNNNVYLKKNILDNAFNSFDRRFDDIYGGFTGSKNKFPKPHDYSFLTKYYFKTNNPRSYEIVKKSLYEMKRGGIYDQIGFGFHRYSTDKKWLVPHFEKMLYDQAMLIHAYLDAYLINNDIFYKDTVEEICKYVLRDMTDEAGGFYSAEDADSQGEEGIFYIWDEVELKNLLNEDEYIFISDILNIESNGNSVVEGKRTNIPHFTKNWNNISLEYAANDVKDKYNLIRKKIFLHREKRVHPQKDDKILTDWNGLMISALSRAAAILENNDYLIAAKKSADFIIDNLVLDDGKLLKRFRNDIAGIDGMIEDYAFFIWGLIELYEADFEVKYIELAAKLSDYQIEHFWDFENKGFYFTSDISEELIVKSKEIYDGAIPSGNSVSAYNYIRLSRILSRYDYEEITLGIIDAFAYNLNRHASGSTMLLQALNFLEGPSYEVIIAGDRNKAKDVIKFIQKNNNPNKVIIYNDSESKLFDFLDYYKPSEHGKPLVYVCQNYSCKLPTSDVEKIKNMLK